MNRWYTDRMTVYRVEERQDGGLTHQKRQEVYRDVPCRIYRSYRSDHKALSLSDTAALSEQDSMLMLGLDTEIRAGDELHITRGGGLGRKGLVLRAFASMPNRYDLPLGGVGAGLAHQEIRLLSREVVE